MCSAKPPLRLVARARARRPTAASRPAGTRAQRLQARAGRGPAQAAARRSPPTCGWCCCASPCSWCACAHLKDAPDRGAAAGRARDARDLRAARQPPRHLAAQVGTRGPRLPLQRARGLQAHRRLARQQARRARALHRGRASRAGARARATPASTAEITGRPKHIYSIWRKMQRKSLALRRRSCDVLARAHHGRHGRRLLRRARRRARPVAATSPASSTTTSPRPRTTTTARCTPR
ncbi:MAG: hypothetical protein MZW92_34085 [Comamonadaceae bacterium]|nr:hypothetical protein [Comamonadaceae bacterium]